MIVKGKAIRLLQGGSGKPMLFLHGWPTTPPAYKCALELLAKRFTVYAPYMFDTKCKNVHCIADCLKAMLKGLGLGKVVVVGTSFGGAVAGLLAQDNKLVSHVVLVNPAGVPRHASFAKMFANLLKSSAFMLAHGRVEHLFHRFSAAFSFFASLRHREMRKLFKEIKSSTKTHGCYLFQNITAKTTLVWCTKDFTFPLSNAHILHTMIKHSKLLIVEGDHYWPFHKPKHFAETVISAVK